MTNTVFAEPSDVEILVGYFEQNKGSPDKEREAFLCMMLGKVVLAPEPHEPLEWQRMEKGLDEARKTYIHAFYDHFVNVLRPEVEKAKVEGPVRLLDAVFRTIKEVMLQEVEIRYGFYSTSDITKLTPSNQEAPVPHQVAKQDPKKEDDDRQNETLIPHFTIDNIVRKWKRVLRRHRGISDKPDELVKQAGNIITEVTSELLDLEESRLVTRRKLSVPSEYITPITSRAGGNPGTDGVPLHEQSPELYYSDD